MAALALAAEVAAVDVVTGVAGNAIGRRQRRDLVTRRRVARDAIHPRMRTFEWIARAPRVIEVPDLP